MREINKQISIDAPIDKVWAVLMDYDDYPQWNPFIRHLGSDNKVGKRFRLKLVTRKGKIMRFRPTLIAFEPMQTLRWKGNLLHDVVFTGEHYFSLHANDDGTTTFAQGEIFRGLLLPVMGRTIADLEKGFVAMNQALKQRCEQE